MKSNHPLNMAALALMKRADAKQQAEGMAKGFQTANRMMGGYNPIAGAIMGGISKGMSTPTVSQATSALGGAATANKILSGVSPAYHAAVPHKAPPTAPTLPASGQIAAAPAQKQSSAPMNPALLGGLRGAALGGLGLGAIDYLRRKRPKDALRSAAVGSVLGGISGAGVGHLWNQDLNTVANNLVRPDKATVALPGADGKPIPVSTEELVALERKNPTTQGSISSEAAAKYHGAAWSPVVLGGGLGAYGAHKFLNGSKFKGALGLIGAYAASQYGDQAATQMMNPKP